MTNTPYNPILFVFQSANGQGSLIVNIDAYPPSVDDMIEARELIVEEYGCKNVVVTGWFPLSKKRKAVDMEDKEESRVKSTSDARVVNNVMRHNYRVLSESEKLDMQAIKDMGLDFIDKLYRMSGHNDEVMPTEGAPFASRELSIAATKMEEAVMWAVKHITK